MSDVEEELVLKPARETKEERRERRRASSIINVEPLVQGRYEWQDSMRVHDGELREQSGKLKELETTDERADEDVEDTKEGRQKAQQHTRPILGKQERVVARKRLHKQKTQKKSSRRSCPTWTCDMLYSCATCVKKACCRPCNDKRRQRYGNKQNCCNRYMKAYSGLHSTLKRVVTSLMNSFLVGFIVLGLSSKY